MSSTRSVRIINGSFISTVYQNLGIASKFTRTVRYKETNKEIKLIIKDSDDTSRKMKKQVDTLIIGAAFGDDVDAKEVKDINPLSLVCFPRFLPRIVWQSLQEVEREHLLSHPMSPLHSGAQSLPWHDR